MTKGNFFMPQNNVSHTHTESLLHTHTYKETLSAAFHPPHTLPVE